MHTQNESCEELTLCWVHRAYHMGVVLHIVRTYFTMCIEIHMHHRTWKHRDVQLPQPKFKRHCSAELIFSNLSLQWHD
jgi:hypothetical protein